MAGRIKLNNDNLLLKNSTKNRINKILNVFLILTECTAVINCCAIINVLSQLNEFQRERDAGTEVIKESITSAYFETKIKDAVREYEEYLEELNRWKGPVLSKSKGTVMGPSGKETYYNLNMSGVVRIMRSMGNNDEYWVREDGCKMLDYSVVAEPPNLMK